MLEKIGLLRAVSRPKNDRPARKIEPVIPAGAYACLQALTVQGRYGSTPNEVARYLILRGLDDLGRVGQLAKEDAATETFTNGPFREPAADNRSQ